MPTTPILGITQVSTSQNGKETTINDAIIALESATNAKLVVSLAAGNVTLSASEATRNYIFVATEATTAGELRFPTEVNSNPYNRVIVVRNESGYGLTVRFASLTGSVVTIPNGESRLISAADGEDMTVAAEPPSVITFLSLTDVPESYTGQTGRFLSVNVAENALEFVDGAVFPSLTGNENKFLMVNNDATGVEWSDLDAANSFTDLLDTPTSYAGQGGKLVRVNDLATGLEFIESSDSEAAIYQSAERWRLFILEPGIWPVNPPGLDPSDPEYITQTDQVGFGEIEFLDQDGIGLTGTGTATASNFLTGNEPSRAFNTNVADGWITEESYTGDLWIEYEFSAPVAPRRIQVSSITDFPQYSATRFLIQYWDGTAWITLGDRSPAPWASEDTQTFKINGVPLDSLPEAPLTGSLYGRINGAWMQINAEAVADNTTSSNLESSRVFQYRRYTNAGAKTLNIRTNSTHDMPVDAEWYLHNGAGDSITIVPAGGVTVNAPAGGSLVVPLNGTVRIKRVATDVYDVFGDTVSSAPIGAEEIPAITGNADKVLTVKTDASGIEWRAPLAPYTDEQVRDVIGSALVAGTNVTITNNDAGNTITIDAASIGLNAEEVRDTIGATLQGSGNISVTVNDATDTITITTSALDAEGVRDTIGAALTAGANVTLSVNDAGNTINIASSTNVEDVQDIIANTLVAGANITISYDDEDNLIVIDSAGGGGGLDAEGVRDVIGSALVAGTNVTLSVNDAADTITINATTDQEVVRDTVASTLVAGSNVTIVNNDDANTITISATGGGSTDPETVRDTIADALVAGANVTITVDDSGDTITISATGGGSTDPETVRDTIADALVAGANVTITVDDSGDTITISAASASLWFWPTVNGVNGDNFATKGAIINPYQDITVTRLGARINRVSGASYQMGIYELNSSNQITSVVAVSSTVVAGASGDSIVLFYLDDPVILATDSRYAIVFTRTDATTTTDNGSYGSATTAVVWPVLAVKEATRTGTFCRLASVSPTVGNTFTTGNGAYSVALEVNI